MITFVEAELAHTRECLDRLTPSERPVVDLLVDGYTTFQIASMLHLSVPTIRTHTKHALAKFSVSSQQTMIILVWKLYYDDLKNYRKKEVS